MMHKCYLPIYDEKKSIFFALGRNAIYAVCKMLNIKADDEILTPAFDCDGALQPFRVLGCRLNFFRSNPFTFSVDLGDLKKRVTPKTKLIHIINHFGMPQPWDKLLAFRKETGIPVLEDNAYSLFSKFEDKSFGEFGDFSIFSLRKNLPLLEGGMLYLNNPKYTFNPAERSSWVGHPLQIPSILNMIKSKSGLYKTPGILKYFLRKFNPEIAPPPPLYSDSEKDFPEWPLRDRIGREFSCNYLRPISPMAKRQLFNFSADDYMEIINKKRRYYSFLSKKLADFDGITVLWPELPDGAAPFCLSVLIKRNRDVFLNALRKKYEVMAWPTLSNLVLNRLEDFPEVVILGRELLQVNLPADKVRSPKFGAHIDSLVNDLRNLARGYLLKD